MTTSTADPTIAAPTATAVLDYLVTAVVDDPDAVEVDASSERGTVAPRACTSAPTTWVASSASGAGSPTPSAPSCAPPRSATASRSTSSSSTERLDRGADALPLLEVGRIGRRPHGLRGEVRRSQLVTDRTERARTPGLRAAHATERRRSTGRDRVATAPGPLDRALRGRRRPRGGRGAARRGRCGPSRSTTPRRRSGCTSSSACEVVDADGRRARHGRPRSRPTRPATCSCSTTAALVPARAS